MKIRQYFFIYFLLIAFNGFSQNTAQRIYSSMEMLVQQPMMLKYTTEVDQSYKNVYGKEDAFGEMDGKGKGWVEALPIGNGKLGGMLFGNVYKEHLQLNEESLWAGFRKNTNNPKAYDALLKVRRLIFEGDHRKATGYAVENMMGTTKGVKSYEPLGDVFIEFTTDTAKAYSNYERLLNLDSAYASVSYTLGGNVINRTAFASSPDKVLVMKIKSQQSRGLNCVISLSRIGNAKTVTGSDNTDMLIMNGQLIAIENTTGENKGELF